MASWGKQIPSGFKLVIQFFLSFVLASVFIFDAAADTNTVIDGNSDTDADIGIFTNTNIVTIRLTENYMPLRYDGMLHVIRYASSGMLLLVFGANSLYMYRCSYGDRSRDRYGRRHIVVVGARRTTMNTEDTGYRYRYVSTDKETDTASDVVVLGQLVSCGCWGLTGCLWFPVDARGAPTDWSYAGGTTGGKDGEAQTKVGGTNAAGARSRPLPEALEA